MHHYPFHIGDYRSATAHLNDAEDLAYRRVLDYYYDTEEPIHLDIVPVARKLRVSAGVLEIVLIDFFEKQEDGWHHLRCDAEILKYSHFVEDGKKGAAKRWKHKVKSKQELKDSPPIAPLSNNDSPPNQGLIATVNREPLTEKEDSKPFVSHEKIVFDGKCFQNINGQLSVWKNAYPAVDIDLELKKAAAWLVSNPKNKKSQLGRFINSWLSKAQDSAPRVGGTSKAYGGNCV